MSKNFALDLKNNFYSNGKLLLTGEYLVLDGATALAMPTRYGQSLEVTSSEEKGIFWKSLDQNGAIWFEEVYRVEDCEAKVGGENKTSQSLSYILQQAKNLNPKFLENQMGLNVTTRLDFPQNWGLGSSSTLINNIAQWAEIDAFTLLTTSFGGSGYDIAAAQNNTPILYKIEDGAHITETVAFNWNFINSLFFVHLNKKQDSKEGITIYKNTSVSLVQRSIISAISHSLLVCESLLEFEKLLQKHEDLVSEIIQLPTVKQRLFSDYSNTIKSLGAWGGDFVLAIGDEGDHDYFRKKGYNTIVPFSEMIL